MSWNPIKDLWDAVLGDGSPPAINENDDRAGYDA